MNTLVRWNPRATVRTPADFERLFGSLAGPGVVTQGWSPATDLVEREDYYVLRADLPGVAEDDVSIVIEDGRLTFSGERPAETTDETEGYQRMERETGSFSRTVRLPKGVDAEAVSATFERGVLEVRVPKPEAAKPHKVAIAVQATDQPEVVEAPAEEK